MINKLKRILASKQGKIALGGGIIILMISLYWLISQSKLDLVSTSPDNNQEGVSLGEDIIFNFSQDLDDVSWQITTTPEFAYQYSVNKTILTISPDSLLQANTTYSIKLNYQNQEETLVFSTIQIDQAVVEAGEGDPQADEDLADYQDKNYPLFAVTPKQTVNWTANYAGPLELVISYNGDVDLSLIQEEVWAWVESFGWPYETHQYIWQIK